MNPSELLQTALEVRRGQIALSSLAPDLRLQVRQTLRRTSDAQLGRLAAAQERKRGHYQLRA